MRKRMMIVAAGALLCGSGLAIAQDAPVTSSADTIVVDSSRTTLSGNAVLVVNGVTVRADRAVIQDREVTLEGNVRLTLPTPVYTSAAMRRRVAPPAPAPVPLRLGPQIIDPPMPKPWQPPQRNQR